MLPSFLPALLALADGTVLRGYSIGAPGYTTGEVVFNTAITGYQEILTDPSYARQLVTLCYPHIGNVGVNDDDIEASQIHAAGLIIRDLPVRASNFRMTRTLSDYLRDQGIVAIAGIDTRRLTRLLREQGAQNGCILAGAGANDTQQAVAQARACPGLAGMDLAKGVSTQHAYQWTQTEWRLNGGQEFRTAVLARHADADSTTVRQGGVTPLARLCETPGGFGVQQAPQYRVVVFDYGVKFNILRLLAARGCRLTVLPAQATAADALALNPDGVLISNGPGDPQACDYAIRAVRELIDCGMPVFGICLGLQIMALAIGAQTVKMKTGHHGANHPVQDLDDGRVLITSQNHGFAVDPATLPANARITHLSLFDRTLQGFALTDRPVFCFQGHPEASPGPHDISYLFDRFTALMARHQRG